MPNIIDYCEYNSFIISIYTVPALFLWLKLIYYLRIEKEFGKFVYMILQILQSISAFIIFLMMSFIGFAFVYEILYEIPKYQKVSNIDAVAIYDELIGFGRESNCLVPLPVLDHEDAGTVYL